MPRLRSLGEDGLIDRLVRRLGRIAPGPPDGIGDDGARLRPRAGRDLVWSTDLLLEDVHFRRKWAAPRQLGRKALAVNFSDLAAMGAVPRAFLLTLALPGSLPLDWIDRFLDGLAAAARAAGAYCAGGDTSVSPQGVQIGVTVAGEVPKGVLLRRDTARPGDGLWVSGPLGASEVGLRLLEAGRRTGAVAWERRAIAAHLDPRPPLELGPWLAARRVARAGIDLSDGLSRDLGRLCRAAGTGAQVEAWALPVHPSARRWARTHAADPEDLVLHGGEDYALLFTVPRRKEAQLRYLPPGPGVRPVRIGKITEPSPGLRLLFPDGRQRPLPERGFRHFRSR